MFNSSLSASLLDTQHKKDERRMPGGNQAILEPDHPDCRGRYKGDQGVAVGCVDGQRLTYSLCCWLVVELRGSCHGGKLTMEVLS